MVWPVYGVYIVAVIFIIGGSQSTQRKPLTCRKSLTVLDLPLCLGVLKHWASLARGGAHLPAKIFFYDGFWLMWCIFKFEGILFRSDSRHNDRVDSLLECVKKQAVMTVAQWHRNQIIRWPLVIGKKKLKMDSCLYGAILNLTAFCSIWTLIL